LEEGLEKVVKHRVEAVLKRAQVTYESDFLKMGDRVRNEYPVYWHRVEKRWDRLFPKVEVMVKARAEVNSAVLKVRGGKR
jgi:spore germination protein KC